MGRFRRLAVIVLFFAAGLLFVGPASAGPFGYWSVDGDGQPTSYSPFHFWAPRAARINDQIHGPHVSVFAPDRHPEIPPTVLILKFPCPAVDGAATIIEPPTPPATSRFKY